MSPASVWAGLCVAVPCMLAGCAHWGAPDLIFRAAATRTVRLGVGSRARRWTGVAEASLRWRPWVRRGREPGPRRPAEAWSSGPEALPGRMACRDVVLCRWEMTQVRRTWQRWFSP